MAMSQQYCEIFVIFVVFSIDSNRHSSRYVLDSCLTELPVLDSLLQKTIYLESTIHSLTNIPYSHADSYCSLQNMQFA